MRKDISTVFAALSMILMAVCIVFNFESLAFGTSPNPGNFILSIAFIVAWIATIYTGRRNRKILILALIVWILFTVVSINVLLANLDIFSSDWLIPLVVIVGGALYGLLYFTGSHLIGAALMSIISFSLMLACILSLVTRKTEKFRDTI